MNDRLPVGRMADGDAPPTWLALDAGQQAAVQVDRACAELRRGRLLVLQGQTEVGPGQVDTGLVAPVASGWLVAAVETLGAQRLRDLQQADPALRLLLSAERLQALGWSAASTARTLALPAALTLPQLQQLCAVEPGGGDRRLLGDPAAAELALQAALLLCKRARLLPALLVLPLTAADSAALRAAQVLAVDPALVAQAVPALPAAVRRVSEAAVPLTAHSDCRLLLYRETEGDAEHVAIVVGRPEATEPVAVRLHSSCLTGDLLGSLRCDCGPQLQRAITRLADSGGVLLYLAQEGRGTGLANKLRAYGLQDGGLDTLQADRHLGFREDERSFQAAAAMLRDLGFLRIQLLTNNPQKIDALRLAGIDVVGRLPLVAPVNAHNARYVQTKRQAGHLGADD